MCGKSSKKVEKVAEEIGYPGFDKNVWKKSQESWKGSGRDWLPWFWQKCMKKFQESWKGSGIN